MKLRILSSAMYFRFSSDIDLAKITAIVSLLGLNTTALLEVAGSLNGSLK